MLAVVIEQMFETASLQWQGCDWMTEFGPYRVNLCGLRAAQASRLARATSGAESAVWRQAADWLAIVEESARAAREAATGALDAARRGDFDVAIARMETACRIESEWPRESVWAPVCRAIEALCPAVATL